MSLEWTLLGLRILAAVLLYSFLGLAVYVIWQDLRRTGSRHQVRVSHQLRVLASANDDPSLTTGDVLLLQPVTWLGRNADNTIVLGDAAASGRHACLQQENGVWWLQDLDSTNGTLLNDLPLSKPATLAEGDVIGIGSLRLKFELETELDE